MKLWFFIKDVELGDDKLIYSATTTNVGSGLENTSPLWYDITFSLFFSFSLRIKPNSNLRSMLKENQKVLACVRWFNRHWIYTIINNIPIKEL